jgi:hypothetical protein
MLYGWLLRVKELGICAGAALRSVMESNEPGGHSRSNRIDRLLELRGIRQLQAFAVCAQHAAALWARGQTRRIDVRMREVRARIRGESDQHSGIQVGVGCAVYDTAALGVDRGMAQRAGDACLHLGAVESDLQPSGITLPRATSKRYRSARPCGIDGRRCRRRAPVARADCSSVGRDRQLA